MIELFDLPRAESERRRFSQEQLDNADIFKKAIEKFKSEKIDAFFLFLRNAILARLSVYYTATVNDRGFRIGVKTPGEERAEVVVIMVKFEQDGTPKFSSWNRSGYNTPIHTDVPMFEGNDLSQDAHGISQYLANLVSGPIAKPFLSVPYDHEKFKKIVSSKLPYRYPAIQPN